MKLICNLSMFGPQPMGISVYSDNCVQGLSERFHLSVIAGGGVLPQGEVLLKAPKSIAIGSGRLAAIRRYLWARSLRFASDDLVYSPTHHGLSNQPGQIITIHDIISLHLPQNKQIYIFYRFFLPRLLKQCRAVFTVSETSRQGIAASYGYPLERIFVVPNGVDTTAFKPTTLLHTGDPFLLMVGGRHPHKNVAEALEMSRYWSKDYRLIIASCPQSAHRSMLEQKVRDLGLTGRVEFKGFLSHDELLRLYQNATALLYPSRIEGFGIPPLEALACGTPVIASDIPVLREVLGEAAQFVKLSNPQSWGEAMSLLASASDTQACLAKGRELLSRFTWSNAVAALERALLSVEPRLEDVRRNSVNC